MKEIYTAVINLDHVYGAVILDRQGNSLYDPLELNKIEHLGSQETWVSLIGSGLFSRELDLIFDQGRLYIRQIGQAYLMVFMNPEGSAASLSLTCDLLEAEGASPSAKKPRKKFFNLF